MPRRSANRLFVGSFFRRFRRLEANFGPWDPISVWGEKTIRMDPVRGLGTDFEPISVLERFQQTGQEKRQETPARQLPSDDLRVAASVEPRRGLADCFMAPETLWPATSLVVLFPSTPYDLIQAICGTRCLQCVWVHICCDCWRFEDDNLHDESDTLLRILPTFTL